MKALLSILIPAHNAERWIGDALRSALAQTWNPKEIIVVDDGSGDHTLDAIKPFASPQVKIAAQSNRGASAARNHALRLCQGDIIQWLDADDLLAPDKVDQQLKACDITTNRRTLLSSAWGRFYCRPHKNIERPDPLWASMKPVDWLTRKMEHNAWMSIESWLMNRELAEAAGPWDERILRDNDGEYFSRVIASSDAVVFCPRAKSFVRRGNPASLSSNSQLSEKRLDSLFLSMSRQIEHLRKLADSARTRRACLTYLQELYVFWYPERPDLVEKAQTLAASMGGTLAPPHLEWKYLIIRNTLGWTRAKSARDKCRSMRAVLNRGWDSILYACEKR